MDNESNQNNITTQEDIEYLHISEEAQLVPSHQSKQLFCKLWKLCLLNRYGGSEANRLWCKNAHDTITKNILAEGEGAKEDSLTEFDSNDLEYLDQEDLERNIEVIMEILDEDKSVDRKYHVFAKDLIKLAISHGCYDARFRVAVKTFSNALEVEWDVMDKFEQSLVEELVKIKSEEEERDKKRHSEQQKRNLKRAFVIGLTAVGGGAILALSAGLAAPLIGAGAVAVLGSGSAAIFTGASGLAVITSIFGAAGAGLTGYKMTKRIGKIEQFEFGSLSNGKHLHMTLAVSGFCGDEDDEAGFHTPWEALDNSTEQYFLKWEGKYLRKLGSSIIDFVKREAMQAAVKGILKYTALRAVLKSIAWPLTLISAANLIDNPWNVCTQRSKETGIHLAHVLLSRHQGYRPVTLIGFSLGARVIFYCLQTMLNEKDYQGIIEDVILIGAPVGVSNEEWEALESVISGTLYNCYSRSDWLLKFVYRAASVQVGDIAGLGPISVSWPRLVNIDLTEKVNSHSEYAEPTVISDILQLIGYKTKPVHSKLQPSAVKLPHEFVRDISRTPGKILPPNFASASKEKLLQSELTAEEQETLDRLTSCQNSNVIGSFKSGLWRGEDQDQSPWQKMVAMTKRGSMSSETRMLPAPSDVEWQVGADEQAADDDENGTDIGVSVGQRSNEVERSSQMPDQASSGKEQSLACCSGVDSLKRSDSGRDLDANETEVNQGQSLDNYSIGESSKGRRASQDESNKNQNFLKSLETSEASGPVHEIKSDTCLVFINDIQCDLEKEAKDDENVNRKSGKLDLPFLPRTERSKSSGDIKTDAMRSLHINVPGKGLFNKVRKNMKFALPSPTLGRHRKGNNEKAERRCTERGSMEQESAEQESMEQESAEQDSENKRLAELFPKKTFRKISLPGPL